MLIDFLMITLLRRKKLIYVRLTHTEEFLLNVIFILDTRLYSATSELSQETIETSDPQKYGYQANSGQ